jgi:hypothetical protein
MKLYEEALSHLDANARSRTIIDKTSILFYRGKRFVTAPYH